MKNHFLNRADRWRALNLAWWKIWNVWPYLSKRSSTSKIKYLPKVTVLGSHESLWSFIIESSIFYDLITSLKAMKIRRFCHFLQWLILKNRKNILLEKILLDLKFCHYTVIANYPVKSFTTRETPHFQTRLTTKIPQTFFSLKQKSRFIEKFRLIRRLENSSYFLLLFIIKNLVIIYLRLSISLTVKYLFVDLKKTKQFTFCGIIFDIRAVVLK